MPGLMMTICNYNKYNDMNTTLTREEAAQLLASFLDYGSGSNIVYVSTSQGPGYPIELHANDDVTIAWGADDEEWELSEFHVCRKGESEGHDFTHDQANELRIKSQPRPGRRPEGSSADY